MLYSSHKDKLKQLKFILHWTVLLPANRNVQCDIMTYEMKMYSVFKTDMY